MNIHLITYLTSKLFWIYTVFRYNTILYPKNEDTQKLFAYFCAYLLSCWGSMQWGTMYGDLIFELIALLIITVAYQASVNYNSGISGRLATSCLEYTYGIYYGNFM